uniref:Myb/SANT-like domain-containing protein n=1 Tax=Oryza nivara TaxID=4536 RepID=A0A0E0GPW0_ORYNI
MATDKSNIRLNKYTSGKEEKQMLLFLKFHIDGQLQTSRKILIVPAIPRIGEDEPPPSWDFVLTPKAMVGRGSPKLSMIPKGSPKFGRMLSAASTRMKTVSPQSILAKKTASSPKGNQVKQRAIWNAELEKSLVEILFEYKVNGCRGDNGWTTKGWNRMVKEFHAGNKCVSFTKNQVQEEGQLKRDYKMLKAVRQQSGSSWNEKRCMVEGSPAMWQNMQIISGFTFPKIKKFRNNKASFPLYDALGELYDGHLAEGKHNCTSFDSMEDEKPLRLVQELEDDSQEQDDVVLLEDQRNSREEETDVVLLGDQRNPRDKETQAEDSRIVTEEQRRQALIAKRRQKKKITRLVRIQEWRA